MESVAGKWSHFCPAWVSKTRPRQVTSVTHLGSRSSWQFCRVVYPGLRHAAPRRVVEDDLFEFGSEFEMDPFEVEEDEDMCGLATDTPRMALGDMFDELANKKTSPQRNPRRGVGWTSSDLGGEGLVVESFFAQEASGSSVSPAKEKSPSVLGTIQWDDLQKMHPNKIFAISIEYIVQRAPQVAKGRLTKGKVKPWRYELAMLSQNPMRELDIQMSARLRGDAYYSMVAWVSRLSGRSIRVVQNEMKDEWLVRRKWQNSDEKVKRRFHFLKVLEKEPSFQEAFPELFVKRVNGRSTTMSFLAVGERAQEPLPVTQCHGYMATYNTSLGLQDSQVLEWVQQGLRGRQLGDKLKNHDLHRAAFRRFVTFQRDLAERHRFKTWAVALEHSEHGDHPARVHLHVYAGVDIRGGHLLMGMPQTRPVSKESLEWIGCGAPWVKFTTIKRPSPSTIMLGVSTGMYYVAGAKSSNLMLEASLQPFVD